MKHLNSEFGVLCSEKLSGCGILSPLDFIRIRKRTRHDHIIVMKNGQNNEAVMF